MQTGLMKICSILQITTTPTEPRSVSPWSQNATQDLAEIFLLCSTFSTCKSTTSLKIAEVFSQKYSYMAISEPHQYLPFHLEGKKKPKQNKPKTLAPNPVRDRCEKSLKSTNPEEFLVLHRGIYLNETHNLRTFIIT